MRMGLNLGYVPPAANSWQSLLRLSGSVSTRRGRVRPEERTLTL